MPVDDFLYKKMLFYLGFEATQSQDSLFKALSVFINCSDSNKIMVINGYAGTGKTSAIASLVTTITELEQPFILMAPTGRAAKVLSNYTNARALTIHKQIYRQKSLGDGFGQFVLDINKYKDTIFIVDEASLISSGSSDIFMFGSGDLLEDLMKYVFSRENNKLILIGDSAQLPPIGADISRALDSAYLSKWGGVIYCSMTDVVRQAQLSGILHNATLLRHMIERKEIKFPKFELDSFDDIESVSGNELLEKIGEAYDSYGNEETLVLCRSNKRANLYNREIRYRILCREEHINKGDKVMVVKNCYQFAGNDVAELDFIANGDVAELVKISHFEERYGFHFADAVLKFLDYHDIEISAKVILDTLESESASLSSEQQKSLFDGVFADYSEIRTKRKRLAAVREDNYFNAMQIKFAAAVTCHKSQGGQWKCVFIDNPFWRDYLTLDDLKWLYTAITRGFEHVYLVNFNNKFFNN